MRTLYVLWSLSLIIPLWGGWMLSFFVIYFWGPQYGYAPIVISSIATVFAGICLVQSINHRIGPRRRLVPWAAVAGGCFVSLTPALTRIVIPWEEPGTGRGSPMATLIGIVILVFLATPYLLTGLIGVLRLRSLEP